MDLETEPSKQTTPALSKADQKRLERLAKLGGRTPRSMLRFVLRDGFEECERTVVENIAAAQEFARGESVDHDEVMRSVKQMLAGYDQRARRQG